MHHWLRHFPVFCCLLSLCATGMTVVECQDHHARSAIELLALHGEEHCHHGTPSNQHDHQHQHDDCDDTVLSASCLCPDDSVAPGDLPPRRHIASLPQLHSTLAAPPRFDDALPAPRAPPDRDSVRRRCHASTVIHC